MNKLKQLYRFSDIKYPWLLSLSIVAFVSSLYFNRSYPDSFTRIEIIVYSVVILIAILWSILNYMGNLKVNAIYKKYDDIEAFTKELSMSNEEKSDFLEYITDFVKDLEQNGSTHEEAVKIAISNFQVQEFAESTSNIFVKSTHSYLLGCVSVFVGLVIIIQLVDMIVSLPFIIMAVSFTLALFSIAFISLFCIYKFIDLIIAKK